MKQEIIKKLKETEQLLNKHGWFFELDGKLNAENIETGCHIEGENTLSFLVDTLEDILDSEQNENLKYPSDETLLEQNGYMVFCVSPLEVEHQQTKDFISGQCAHWLVSYLKEQWRKNR